jgi:hypothetical protein
MAAHAYPAADIEAALGPDEMAVWLAEENVINLVPEKLPPRAHAHAHEAEPPTDSTSTSSSEREVDVDVAVGSVGGGGGEGVFDGDRRTSTPDTERRGDVPHPDQPVLIRMYEAGALRPAQVGRRTPDWLSPAAQFVYDDLKLYAGLAVKQGYDATVLYTGDHGAGRSNGRYARPTIANALRELRTARLIEEHTELEPWRKLPNGPKVWRVPARLEMVR